MINTKAKTVFEFGRRQPPGQSGFTLIEMLLATVIVLVGLVAVAQLVPTSVLLNSNNRNDATALIFAQRELEFIREQPLSVPATPPPTFSDPQGVLCPTGSNCGLGDPTQPGVLIGSPVVPFNNAPVIDFNAAPVPGYNFTYTDPNDPFGANNDVRWAVITFTNPNGQLTTGRRIILGVFRRGMKTLAYPITLDTMVER
jgi:prepilin-type N-terminal cleavage/methylation domain-containing protein